MYNSDVYKRQVLLMECINKSVRLFIFPVFCRLQVCFSDNFTFTNVYRKNIDNCGY